MARRTIVAAMFVLLVASSVAAEDQLGVAVYPGAVYDEGRTKLLTESPSVRGAAYRTPDALKKVVAYYRRQGLLFLKIGEPADEVARFKDVRRNVDVVVQNPWKDSRTGATMKDTLIMIYKNEGTEATPGISI